MTALPPAGPAADRRQARRRLATARRTRSSTRPRALEIGQAPDGTAADVEGAIAAARRAFDETDWSTDAELRVRCLRQLHQALLDNADAFTRPDHRRGRHARLHDGRGRLRRAGRGAASGSPTCSSPTSSRPTSASPRRWGSRAAGPYAASRSAWSRRSRRGTSRPRSTSPRSARRSPPAAPSCSSRRRTPRGWPAELGRLVAEHTDIPAGVFNVVTPRSNEVAARADHRPARRHGVLHRLDRRPAGRSWPPPRRR